MSAGGTARVEPMKRAAIIVRDLRRSLRFYQGVLGLNVWVEGEAGPENPTFARLLGMPPCRVRYSILRSGEIVQGMVGLFDVREPTPPEAQVATVTVLNRGEVALVFHASDIESIHRDAVALGLDVLCPPQHLRIPEIGVESLEMTLRDPNGVAVNLIQSLNSGPRAQSNGLSRFAR